MAAHAWCTAGPTTAATTSTRAGGVALGFRRLAIVDLSPTGHQPMLSADGRFVLVFNGEIYNYRDLRERLAGDGAVFRGTSDTEVILELVARRGVRDAVPELWGMFAIAVWDRATARCGWCAIGSGRSRSTTAVPTTAPGCSARS